MVSLHNGKGAAETLHKPVLHPPSSRDRATLKSPRRDSWDSSSSLLGLV